MINSNRKGIEYNRIEVSRKAPDNKSTNDRKQRERHHAIRLQGIEYSIVLSYRDDNRGGSTPKGREWWLRKNNIGSHPFIIIQFRNMILLSQLCKLKSSIHNCSISKH